MDKVRRTKVREQSEMPEQSAQVTLCRGATDAHGCKRSHEVSFSSRPLVSPPRQSGTHDKLAPSRAGRTLAG